MTRAHRASHRRIWIVLWPLLAAAFTVVVVLSNR